MSKNNFRKFATCCSCATDARDVPLYPDWGQKPVGTATGSRIAANLQRELDKKKLQSTKLDNEIP